MVCLIFILGKCVAGTCEHTRARNWVQCERCTQWYHCVCVKISLTKARDGTFNCC
ncbi:hypothetical protein GBAR_LOCUS27607 [Geodia barretti]|uniref:PHD-type domain-containing protein n=1 Tax=Geodia barretti TaxID=519541 RepID=A0AA35TL83_GEOBA|nr:hypothetical protein GBAR_LOCUS27607 [Geodia barretti]